MCEGLRQDVSDDVCEIPEHNPESNFCNRMFSFPRLVTTAESVVLSAEPTKMLKLIMISRLLTPEEILQ
jgi:hypothetical protein